MILDPPTLFVDNTDPAQRKGLGCRAAEDNGGPLLRTSDPRAMTLFPSLLQLAKRLFLGAFRGPIRASLSLGQQVSDLGHLRRTKSSDTNMGSDP